MSRGAVRRRRARGGFGWRGRAGAGVVLPPRLVGAGSIDQGRGWRGLPSDWQLIVADESGLPAAAGILRDMPREAVGHALIELFDERDRQHVDAPEGMTVHWLIRDPAMPPGTRALPYLQALDLPGGVAYAFVVGEQALATGARRHLVRERGIDRRQVTFSGYWKRGAATIG
ncbi:siderophore-interacting protein [Microbacterium sediminis]|nr:siderophore-interacting protein [Microbacterium sediminis]